MLHAAQAAGVLVLASDFALPVRATYLAGPPGADAFEPTSLFDVPTGLGVAAFLALSALAHLVVATVWFRRYRSDLARHRNPARWVEYSLSAPLVIVLIAQLVGIAGVVPWLAILIYLLSPAAPGDVTPPTFVYAVFISLFVCFNVFALNQWLQYRARGRWSDYLYGENVCIVLSLTAKSVLAWQVFAGALAG